MYISDEKRTLTCFGNDIQNGDDYGIVCKLAIADSSKLLETECYDETYVEEPFREANSEYLKRQIEANNTDKIPLERARTVCNIQCDGADRDSFTNASDGIIITPCEKLYRLSDIANAFLLFSGEQWYIWRSGKCRNVTITFEVHCGFPTQNPNDKQND
uniref:ZP domain-containing protein n=1 Tax=Elaeophora elaphi TaxID=1147741 RepID=A0A0R3S2C5_9BILA